MKETPDGIRISETEGNHEVMGSEHHDDIMDQATLEKHRKMDSDEWYYRMTPYEPTQVTPPEEEGLKLGLLRAEEEPETRSVYAPGDDLVVTFLTDSWPQENRLILHITILEKFIGT